ncbi:MAG: carboxypeptidase regulatory-like domain-containing protein [Coriobacteriia bacterium]|nr:carboxypeptidase regulatory-like domain-containing protein [Coriobacteriia bacterium]
MKRNTILIAIGAVIVVAIIAAVVALRLLPQGGDGGNTGSAEEISLDLTVGETADFTFGGEEHSAELIECIGESAQIVISSSPTPYTLTEGQQADADLDEDSIADAVLTANKVGTDSASVTISAPEYRTWDESNFETFGGLAPYKIRQFYETDPSLIVRPDGTYMLFYVCGDLRAYQWEIYSPDGTQVTSPALGAGRLARTAYGEIGEFADAVGMPDGSAMLAYISMHGVQLTSFNERSTTIGSSFEGEGLNYPALAADGERVWLAATGYPNATYVTTGGGQAVVISEMGAAGAGRQLVGITLPGDRQKDITQDIAYDEKTGTLVILYGRETNGAGNADPRLAIVDADSLEVLSDIALEGEALGLVGYPATGNVACEDGIATTFWSGPGDESLRLTWVDIDEARVLDTWAGMAGSGTPRVVGWFGTALVSTPDGLQLLYADAQPYGGEDDVDPRFVLWPVTRDGFGPEDTVLEGGQPVLADVLPELNAFRTVPNKAICGAQAVFEGAVLNRGSRIARDVTVTVSVDGKELDTIELGSIEEGQRRSFAQGWQVPPDLEAEQVEVVYEVHTETEQYTVDNDSASFEAEVRQKGVVFGRVYDVSRGRDPEAGPLPGLPGARVRIGDRTVLTGSSGEFTVEDIEFGEYEVEITKEGYNPKATTIELTRTRPLRGLSVQLDDHGTLTLVVTDEAGAPLPGVDVWLQGYNRHDVTGENGTLTYSLSKGDYAFALQKRGYYAVPLQEATVILGEESSASVTMREATTAFVTGRVTDKYGRPIPGATLVVRNSKNEVVAQPALDAEGRFAELELTAKPSQTYRFEAAGNGLTTTELLDVMGGDRSSIGIVLAPERGDLRLRQAVEGYCSWMISAGFPGFMEIAAADMFVWYGNYTISVSTTHFTGTDELGGVDVSIEADNYESHATQTEIDFSSMADDPMELYETEDFEGEGIEAWGKLFENLVDEHTEDLIEIGEGIVDNVEAWVTGEGNDYVITGQGPELLTWKEATGDLLILPDYHSDDPEKYMQNQFDQIPLDFSIPLVFAGSSSQITDVRVDRVDVMNTETGDVYTLSDSVWYSHEGTGDIPHRNAKHFDFNTPDVEIGKVKVFVWITIQKYSQGAPHGTCFSQREKQVVIFEPGTREMIGLIAPGDLYMAPLRYLEQ